MKKLISSLLSLFLLFSLYSQSNTSSIRGVVIDQQSKQPIPFANVALLDSLNKIILSSTTDFDGKYIFQSVKPGKYSVDVSFVGYQKARYKGIIALPNKIIFQNFELNPGVKLSEVQVIAYSRPLMQKDNTRVRNGRNSQKVTSSSRPRGIKRKETSSSNTISRQEISSMASRTPADIAKTAGNGTFSRDDGANNINSRGARTSSNVTYVDGVKIIGSSNLPSSAIEEVIVETGGISAQFENDNTKWDKILIPNPPQFKQDKNVPVRQAGVPNSFYQNSYESYEEFADNLFESPTNTPLSTFSIDVDKASYANTRRFLNNGMLPPRSAVRIEEMINYFNYEYPQPTGEHPFSITTEYADCPWNSKRKLALIGIQGEKIEMQEAPKSNLVFLIDVSGSMGSPDKLDLLTSGLELLVDELRKEDRIAIVVYAGAAGEVLSSTSGANKNKIKTALNKLHAGGSTAGGAGIELAYKIAQKHFLPKGNNRVILASDGDFNVGVSDNQSLIKLIEQKRETGVFLSVLGFGSYNLQDDKMEQIANKGNGNYNYIDNIREAKKVLVKEIGGTLVTIAKDVKVQAEFNPSVVKAYRLVGYVNRNLEDEDFNDDQIDAGELGSGHSVTALYEIIPADSDEEIKDIDSLKYQRSSMSIGGELVNEVLTVKFRYKKPKGSKSILMTQVLKDESLSMDLASNNLKFSASVASFGMMLRGSESVEELTFDDIMKLAKLAKGEDSEGYRAEFVNLVEMAELIK